MVKQMTSIAKRKFLFAGLAAWLLALVLPFLMPVAEIQAQSIGSISLALSSVNQADRTATFSYTVSTNDYLRDYTVSLHNQTNGTTGELRYVDYEPFGETARSHSGTLSMSFPSSGTFSVTASVTASTVDQNDEPDFFDATSSAVSVTIQSPTTTTTTQAPTTTTTQAPTTTPTAGPTPSATTTRPTTTRPSATPTPTAATPTTTEAYVPPYTVISGRYRVTADIVAKENPSMSSATVAYLDEGVEVDVVGRTDSNWYITLINGSEAFLPGAYLVEVAGSEPGTTTTPSGTGRATSPDGSEITDLTTDPSASESGEGTTETALVTTSEGLGGTDGTTDGAWGGLTVPPAVDGNDNGSAGGLRFGDLVLDPIVLAIVGGILLVLILIIVVIVSMSRKRRQQDLDSDEFTVEPSYIGDAAVGGALVGADEDAEAEAEAEDLMKPAEVATDFDAGIDPDAPMTWAKLPLDEVDGEVDNSEDSEES